MSEYKVVSDKFINNIFGPGSFGPLVNNCVNEKRKFLAKTLRNQIEGYWSGHTAYHIAIDGGFLKDAKSGEEKHLTALGVAFLQEQAA